jgi:hypothetical protein
MHNVMKKAVLLVTIFQDEHGHYPTNLTQLMETGLRYPDARDLSEDLAERLQTSTRSFSYTAEDSRFTIVVTSRGNLLEPSVTLSNTYLRGAEHDSSWFQRAQATQ